MRPLRYSINITLDGCCHHDSVTATEELHERATKLLEDADALLFGRITYQMMESAFRGGASADVATNSLDPFARTMDLMKKHVVSSTLENVDWNAELIRGNLRESILTLKQQPGKGLLTGGVTLPLALAEMGLIDEYEFVIHPVVAGHGPTLFAGLSKPLDLKPVDRQELRSGALVMRYHPAG
ncbi:MAG: deaminase [Verrucomicrobiaceae bacterium]|nr:MAG: deaminase [Verrucomicrobiaceae bacterium]